MLHGLCFSYAKACTSHYWNWHNTTRNTGIQNAFSQTRFQNILQNLHFANNTPADHADKAYKVRPLIDHFNNAFMDAFTVDVNQSINEHMTEFLRHSSMRRYLQLKIRKWGFKWWLRCASGMCYFYGFDLCLGKKKAVEVNLGKGLVL